MSSNRTNGTKPAIQHTKSILNDRRIRLLLAIVGAIVAWMVVTIVVQPGTTRTINNVPVDFTYDSAAYTSRGLSIVSAPEKYVSLKLSGDGYTIGSLTSSDFVVYPDWSGVRDSGEKTLHLQVRGVNTLLNGVSVSIEGGDNSVDVVFDVVEEKTVPITVTTNYLTIADGYILYSEPIKIQIEKAEKPVDPPDSGSDAPSSSSGNASASSAPSAEAQGGCNSSAGGMCALLVLSGGALAIVRKRK